MVVYYFLCSIVSKYPLLGIFVHFEIHWIVPLRKQIKIPTERDTSGRCVPAGLRRFPPDIDSILRPQGFVAFRAEWYPTNISPHFSSLDKL